MSLRSVTKATLERATPAFLDLARGIRNRWYFGRRFADLHARVRPLLFPSREAIRVKTGCFEGMRYIDAIVWGPITPKWLGSYEVELRPVLDEIAQRQYSTIIDVGCAEGYYAVGLARRVPDARVFAFDNDLVSRRQTTRLAALNDVRSRISVGRYCTHRTLDELAHEGAVVVCDIEGAERWLLDPQEAKQLRNCDILVEVHEGGGGESTESILRRRFSATHAICSIDACDRTAWCASHSGLLPNELLQEATDEHRSNGRLWFWMKSNSKKSRN